MVTLKSKRVTTNNEFIDLKLTARRYKLKLTCWNSNKVVTEPYETLRKKTSLTR